METIHKALSFVALAAVASATLAYKETTHADIAKHATERSDLNVSQSAILTSLALGTSVKERRLLVPGPTGVASPTSVEELVMRGAREEDHGIRSLRHFYDPQRHGRGILAFEPSPEWALASTNEDQQFDLNDARSYLLGALTGATETQRLTDLTLLFRALGHVVHHIQDMHQPQHVRSDLHCDDSPFIFLIVPFPRGCDAAIVGEVLHRPSAYEQYTWEQGRPPLEGYPTADYGTFESPKRFWQGSGMGGAEFTSNNFVSVGANFALDLSTTPISIKSDAEHPFPQGAEARLVSRDINDPELKRAMTDPDAVGGDISFVETTVTDAYRSVYSAANPYTSTLSIWYDSIVDDPNVTVGPSAGFTLNSVNYRAAMEHLLPRAAAYSTGLINYFFRGRIEIGLPADGVYGVLDHATTYAAGQGFDKLKLRLRNASPDGVKPSGERVPQTMQGGTLVAVAKYTLNSCYQPDLSGDYGGNYATGEIIPPANCTWQQYLSGEEHISQSAAILATSLETGSATEFTFDFGSQPIPVNARDLRLQVVYTGPLGSEADGIAFGGRDISEPTYLVVYNNTDYFAVDGKLYTPAQIRGDATLSQKTAGMDIDPRPLATVSLSVVDGRPIVGPSGPVPVNGYVRVAVLADKEVPIGVNVLSRVEGAGYQVSYFQGVPTAVIDLRNPDGYITAFGIYRDPRGNFFDAVFKANSSVPIAVDELTRMSTYSGGGDQGPTLIPVRF